VSFDDRLVCSMKPGWHTIDELASALKADYAKVLFSLERLVSFGFAVEHEDRYALTYLGAKLYDVLDSR
jgi:predicted transcriptional regulator